MHNFMLFAGNVSSHWIYLMSGLFGVVGWLIATIKHVKPWNNVFWVFALMAILASTERAWQDEHRNEQTVEAEKMISISAYNSCQLNAKIEDGYKRGLEYSALSDKERINKQQSVNDKQANDISGCLMNLAKMNPQIQQMYSVIVVKFGTKDVVTKIFSRGGPGKPLITDNVGLMLIQTNVEKSSMKGTVTCNTPFTAESGVTVDSKDPGASVTNSKILPVGDRSYELTFSKTDTPWNMLHPAYISIRYGAAKEQCTFAPNGG